MPDGLMFSYYEFNAHVWFVNKFSSASINVIENKDGDYVFTHRRWVKQNNFSFGSITVEEGGRKRASVNENCFTAVFPSNEITAPFHESNVERILQKQ